jgi:ligand-binding SRPBCC domain-containing protein
MRIHTLRREQRLPGAPAAVFGFFSDARNLEAITPPLLRFEVLTPEPVVMGAGVRIHYRLRIHGVALRWLTQITEWEPPHRFVDEQLDGPYALWRHTHSFEADGEETIMRDVVHYRIGFGPLGGLAHALVVRRDLDRIFDYRAERVRQLLAAAGP